jgi:Arc/MetJ-type ribon-helix-helix transcriptional regulator
MEQLRALARYWHCSRSEAVRRAVAAALAKEQTNERRRQAQASQKVQTARSTIRRPADAHE